MKNGQDNGINLLKYLMPRPNTPEYEVNTTDNDIRLIMFMFDVTFKQKLPPQLKSMLEDLKSRILAELPAEVVKSMNM